MGQSSPGGLLFIAATNFDKLTGELRRRQERRAVREHHRRRNNGTGALAWKRLPDPVTGTLIIMRSAFK